MTLADYATRLRNNGALPRELLDARVESGCSDCGRRLTLDREITASVCVRCQDVFLREVSASSDATRPTRNADPGASHDLAPYPPRYF